MVKTKNINSGSSFLRNTSLMLLTKPTGNAFVQLLRYGFVGGAAFVVDFGLLYLLTQYGGLHYQLSAGISFMAGLIVNYLLSISWVFNRSVSDNDALKGFLLFSLIGVVGLGLNALILWVCTEWLGLFYLLSKIISTGIVFLWNFLGRRYLSTHL